MDNAFILDPNLATTQKAFQEIWDLPVTLRLLKITFDSPFPADCALPANYSRLVPREFQLEATNYNCYHDWEGLFD